MNLELKNSRNAVPDFLISKWFSLVVGMAAGILCDAFRIVGLTILLEVLLRSDAPRGAGLHIVLWYVLPVLGLGLVWYRAQRGFEARRMPTEGAE